MNSQRLGVLLFVLLGAITISLVFGSMNLEEGLDNKKVDNGFTYTDYIIVKNLVNGENADPSVTISAIKNLEKNDPIVKTIVNDTKRTDIDKVNQLKKLFSRIKVKTDGYKDIISLSESPVFLLDYVV